MNFELATNLSDLPLGFFHQLSKQLDKDTVWTHLFDFGDDAAYILSPDEFEKCQGMLHPGAYLIRLLGNRGQNVKSFLSRLHTLAKIYGPEMDNPQLILHRKFCPVIWARPEQVLVSVVGDEQDKLKMHCKASGFPLPKFQWYEDEKEVESANSNSLVIQRCSCTARNVFRCKIWNLIEEGQEWSDFYRSNKKQFQSQLISNIVDLKPFESSELKCQLCIDKKIDAENICRMAGNIKIEEDGENQLTTFAETLFAADKVALIISNRAYAPLMENLITPHCDAETLATSLQKLDFKTVTLGDLTLTEMTFIVNEYRKLLGEGVYGVFYFVGHGFEANGSQYLLPIGTSPVNCTPTDCISMDWVMSTFADIRPALNLILLDICRKYLPLNLNAFTAYAEQYRLNVKVNRDTVYGYATSGGCLAYEVKGEENGVFMKYLSRRVIQKLPVIEMLNKVLRDVEKDVKVRDLQIPELRSNLTRPRSLHDPIIPKGHTTSYDHHTYHWQRIHELPTPIQVRICFDGHELYVVIWFNYCGHFTNKVYAFSSVSILPSKIHTDMNNMQNGEGPKLQGSFLHLAYLKFPPEFNASPAKMCQDTEEGISLYVMLSNLQRCRGEVKCTIEIRPKEDVNSIVATKEVALGCILMTQLSPNDSDSST